MSTFDLKNPPKDLIIEKELDKYVIRSRYFSCASLFLLPFTFLWGGFVFAIVRAFLNEGFSYTLLFFLPFILATFVLIGFSLVYILGSFEAKFDSYSCEINSGWALLNYHKTVIWKDVEDVRIGMEKSSKGKITYFLEITGENHVKVGKVLKEDHLEYIVKLFKQLIPKNNA